jgi:hypothetical protein
MISKMSDLVATEYEARKQIKGCTVCGLPKTLHFYKSHPYGAQYKAATYGLDSLGINTDAIVGLEDESTYERIQAEGREMFRAGMLMEDGARLRYAPFDGDYYHDVDLGEFRSAHYVAGRCVIELFSGRGLVGNHPDPTKRIFIVQNESWPSVFARVVALTSFARRRQPSLRVGQRVIVERSMTDKLRFRTPTSGELLALFQVIHVDDIYAIT